MSNPTVVTEKRPTPLELFMLFFKLGVLGFGGPYALLIYLEKEIVEKKKWLPSETFWEGVAVGQLTPGPAFFATAVFCGYRLRGLPGATLAAIASTFPAFVLCILLGYLYVDVQKLPHLHRMIVLLLAVVVGLLTGIVFKDRKKFFSTPAQPWIGLVVFLVLILAHLNPLFVIVIAGLAGALFFAPAKST